MDARSLRKALRNALAVFVVLMLASAVGAKEAMSARGAQGAGVSVDKTVWSGVYTKEQARRGEAVYRDGCARCHLDNLKGSEMGPALIGDLFLAEWNGKTLRAFYGRILSTMPADDPGALDEKAVLDVVAYVLQANGCPAGITPLETADQAERIAIARAK